MDESSDHAREIVDRYRRTRTLDAGMRARVHARLVDSVAIAEPIPLHRRRGVTIAALAIATAAAVILGARLWSPSQATAVRPHDADAAAFGHGDDTPTHEVLPPAEPPPSTSTTTTTTTTTTAPTTVVDPPAIPRGPRPVVEVPATRPDPVLAAELALVASARRALDDGDASLALQRLAVHARDHADGQLAEERDALRIVALCAAGKAPQGRAEATLFHRRHPGSTHADRIARACPP